MVERRYRKPQVVGSIPTLGSRMRRYSRLASVEEKRNVQKAVWFVVLTLGFIVALFFLGIPILGRFVGFVSDLGKSNKPISVNDQTPPAPPKFNTIPDFTNQKSLSMSGNSEAGATVKLTFNGQDQETVADKNGGFTFSNLSLNDGENNFSATAQDPAGNLSQKTKDYIIIFDNKPPELEISSPGDGTQFFGSKQRQVTIQGVTESDVQLTANDRIVAVDDEGTFQYTTSLGDGENKFTLKAVDRAGNSTEKVLTLNFTP